MAKYWCHKVFAKDFRRGLQKGAKRKVGDPCYWNYQCRSHSCNNSKFVEVFKLKKCFKVGWHCVCNSRPSTNDLGDFCIADKNCKSKKCRKWKCVE